jgi:hypothetical protein
MGAENSSLPGAYIRVYKTSLIFADVDLQLNPLPIQVFDQDNGSANTLVTTTTAGSNSETLSSGSGLDTVAVGGASTAEINYPARYFLSERRRLKFKEVHYFDHPKFGAILGVWPSE